MRTTPKTANWEAAELIDLVIARAPALHAAGVTSLAIGGVAITLKPPPPGPADVDDPSPAPEQHSDPLRDAASYAGGRVPGFERPKDGKS